MACRCSHAAPANISPAPRSSPGAALTASLKERGTRAVQDNNGNWLLAPQARPYTEQERQDAQQAVAAINPRLIRAGVRPAVPLSDTPTTGMVWGRSIASTFGYEVTFIQENRDFDGVAIGGRAYVSPNLQYPKVAVIGHEVLHTLKQTDPQAYQALAEQIRPYLGLFSTNDATPLNHHAAPMRDCALKALNINPPMHRPFAAVAVTHIVRARGLQFIPSLLTLVHLHRTTIRLAAKKDLRGFQISLFSSLSLRASRRGKTCQEQMIVAKPNHIAPFPALLP